ncbi:MAG: Sua5/YciO/YrdC/YwlC family protein [bacterium]
MSDAARLEECVADGGVALFPADGLYGLACDPSNRGAIARIHALKGRDEGRPSAVMFFTPLGMREVLAMSGPCTRAAIGALLPGPVTLVVGNPRELYPLACREDRRRLGIRLIAGPLEGARGAVFQTSANRSGAPAPARFEQIDDEILAGVDLALDGGALGGEPSTVVDVTAIDSGGDWRLLREGALGEPAVRQALRALGRGEGTRG